MLTLADILKKSRSEERSVEMECALQDFFDLSHNSQVELLFVELAKMQAGFEGLWDRVKRLEETER